MIEIIYSKYKRTYYFAKIESQTPLIPIVKSVDFSSKLQVPNTTTNLIRLVKSTLPLLLPNSIKYCYPDNYHPILFIISYQSWLIFYII